MKKLLIVVGLVAVGVGGYLYLSGAEYVIEVPEKDISAALQENFPIEQRKAGVLKTSLKNPRLDLDGGSERLTMDLEIAVDLGLARFGLGRSKRGAATISSGLSYDRENGRLMLDGARLEEIRVADLPDQYREPLEEVINKALGGHVDGLVIYELSDSSFQESLARLVLKDIQIGDGVIKAILGIGS